MDAAAWDRTLGGRAIKEVEFVRIQDDPYYVVRLAAEQPAADAASRAPSSTVCRDRTQSSPTGCVVNARTLEIRREPFSVESLVRRLKAAVPDAPIVETTLLSDYDSYYYSRGRQTPLPVLRVKFADPDRTWVYIDPEMSQLSRKRPPLQPRGTLAVQRTAQSRFLLSGTTSGRCGTSA